MAQWELLVTEGHVRAARWRNAVPLVIGLSVIAVILGILILANLPQASASSRVAEAQAALALQRRAAVAAFLQDKGVVAETPADAERALTRETASATVAALLETLNTTGRLPETVVTQNADAFWAGAWQTGTVHAVHEGRTVLIGYYVDAATRYPGYRQEPQIQRAFGLFRRSDEGQWSFHCLQITGAMPCDQQALDPSAIPATMREFLPASAFAVGEPS